MRAKLSIGCCVLVAALSLWLAGCATVPTPAGLRVWVRKSRPFVIVKTEKAGGWGVANHVYLCPINDRRIAISYWVAGDGVFNGVAPVPWPAYSDDRGKTWVFGDPYQYSEGPPTNVQMHIEKGQEFRNFLMGIFFASAKLPTGERVVYSREATPPPHRSLLGLFSKDGVTWEGPVVVPFHVPEDAPIKPSLMWIEQRAVVTEDGRVLCVAYGDATDRDGRPLPNYGCIASLFESRDGGRSFSLVSIVATKADAPWGNGAEEPGLIQLPDGELLCVSRTGAPWTGTGMAIAHPLLASRSRDGGRTWTHTKMPIRGVVPKLELMSNGLLVLVTGRPGNRLYFSADGGRTWSPEVVITPHDRKTSGYCDALEVEPGRLLVVYDAMDTDPRGFWLWEPKEINAIFGVFVDVKRLF